MEEEGQRPFLVALVDEMGPQMMEESRCRPQETCNQGIVGINTATVLHTVYSTLTLHGILMFS
jgi:hypothetical protein